MLITVDIAGQEWSAVLDQHELVAGILCAAGGAPAEDCVPVGYAGRRADVVFAGDRLIAEVKSLASDRQRDPAVSDKLGELFAREHALGGPMPFGAVTVNLHDLPVALAEKALRLVGKRVRKEVSDARAQIAATRAILSMPEAFGLVVFVTPPDRIGHQSIGRLINDAIRQSDTQGLDGALIIETPLGQGAGALRPGDSFRSCAQSRTSPSLKAWWPHPRRLGADDLTTRPAASGWEISGPWPRNLSSSRQPTRCSLPQPQDQDVRLQGTKAPRLARHTGDDRAPYLGNRRLRSLGGEERR